MTENTANRVKVQHFSRIKNYEKIALCMPQIMGWWKFPDPLSLSQKKLPFVEIREYTANHVNVQDFSRIKNYEKIAVFMP